VHCRSETSNAIDAPVISKQVRLNLDRKTERLKEMSLISPGDEFQADEPA